MKGKEVNTLVLRVQIVSSMQLFSKIQIINHLFGIIEQYFKFVIIS